MGYRMHRHPSWNYCTYRLISLAFISGRIVLYASYMCLSLIYCLTHVECFRFFLAANIVMAPKLQTMSAVLQATTMASVSSILRKKGRDSRSCHTQWLEKSPSLILFEAGLKQVCSWLATCLRHAHATLRPGFQPGLQLAIIMKCSLNSSTWT